MHAAWQWPPAAGARRCVVERQAQAVGDAAVAEVQVAVGCQAEGSHARLGVLQAAPR